MSTEKKSIKKYSGFNAGKGKIPSNIVEYLKSRPSEMGKAVRKVNSWLNKVTGYGIGGGTAIGKHYATLVLDMDYQGSEFYVNEDGSIKFRNVEVLSFKEFKEVFEANYVTTA